jgi:TonB family protein
MTEVILFLKIQLALILLYGCYKWIFSHGTNLQVRRMFLLVVLPLSVMHPFLFQPFEADTFLADIQYLDTVVADTVEDSARTLDQNISWALAFWSYYTLAAGLFLLFCWRLLRLLYTIIRSPSERHGHYRFIPIAATASPASFFRTVFIPVGLSDATKKVITDHELIHVRQWHSIDVLVYELAKVLFWINPVIYLLEKELKLVHEFIADEQAGKDAPDFYQQTLLAFTLGIEPSILTNNFYQSSTIKQRLMMLHESNSWKSTIIRTVFMLPFVAALLVVNTGVAQTAEETVLQQAEIMPEFPGGQDAMMKYLAEQIKYPEEARKNKEQGNVFVSFVIDKSGAVRNAEIKRGVSATIDAEAIRVVSNMPAWRPAENKGEKVSVQYVLPIAFRLE